MFFLREHYTVPPSNLGAALTLRRMAYSYAQASPLWRDLRPEAISSNFLTYIRVLKYSSKIHSRPNCRLIFILEKAGHATASDVEIKKELQLMAYQVKEK